MPERSSPETILAFDFGLRRIGVAVGQDVTGSASPLGIISNAGSGPDFEQIERLLEEWRPQRLVVGMPLHSDGSPGDLEPSILEFVATLERFGLPIARIDERHTSQEAEQALINARQAGSRGRIKKEQIDAAAAVFIAERYLLRNL
jgi:putative Holliday junction resolvase